MIMKLQKAPTQDSYNLSNLKMRGRIYDLFERRLEPLLVTIYWERAAVLAFRLCCFILDAVAPGLIEFSCCLMVK